MHSPEVSIIIPAYNTEAYVQQAIDSALNQTVSNIEVIIVDDGSTDSTVSVVKHIRDSRVKLLVNTQNLGVSGARNRALAEARGNWIAVLDSDDWYAPERLERLLQVAKHENADIVADDLYLIRDGENTPWTTLLGQGKAQLFSVQQIDPVYFVETDVYGQPGLHLGFSKPLFKRSFLVKHNIQYNPGLKYAEDFWFTFSCLIRGARFYLVPEPFYYYRSRSNSLIRQSPLERIEKELALIHAFLEQTPVKENKKLVKALLNNARVLTKHRNYHRVIEPVKQKNFPAAIAEILRHPFFLVQLVSRIPGILYRRFRRVFLKKELWEGLS